MTTQTMSEVEAKVEAKVRAEVAAQMQAEVEAMRAKVAALESRLAESEKLQAREEKLDVLDVPTHEPTVVGLDQGEMGGGGGGQGEGANLEPLSPKPNVKSKDLFAAITSMDSSSLRPVPKGLFAAIENSKPSLRPVATSEAVRAVKEKGTSSSDGNASLRPQKMGASSLFAQIKDGSASLRPPQKKQKMGASSSLLAQIKNGSASLRPPKEKMGASKAQEQPQKMGVFGADAVNQLLANAAEKPKKDSVQDAMKKIRGVMEPDSDEEDSDYDPDDW